jgi:tRNA U54 and U55 pseudouridine synthase Pus10
MEKFLCEQCCDFLGYDEPTTSPIKGCPVCLDLFSRENEWLLQPLVSACDPYGGIEINHFTQQASNILLPGDILLRYHIAAMGRTCAPFSKFQSALKDYLRKTMETYWKDRQRDIKNLDQYPSFFHGEEQGFLSVHLLLTPNQTTSRPDGIYRLKSKVNTRKRFRGNDPTEKQGGHPIVNRQKTLERKGYEIWTLSEAESAWENSSAKDKESLKNWFQSIQDESRGSHVHVIVHRLPFYIKSLYTKTRRDISQTPFYVPEKDSNGKTFMKRLGVSSVEEQIIPSILKVIGGVSKVNNDAEENDIIFGMVKFHASGREDMNVRMTLPPENTDSVGGRPFVLEIIDALKVPTPADLLSVVHEINQTAPDDDPSGIVTEDVRSYGRNPMGVGISSCISFVPNKAFRNLQAETEEKVKYYGCECWSENPIPSTDYLTEKLSQVQCPITLQQRTPIRVLHRRPNLTRTRHILSLKATKVDDHYFRLHLSTDAGTYVKEFVHGDLGRTVPSVSSLLGCKTDIPILDCEGIQLG